MNDLPQLVKAGLASLPTPLQELKNLSEVLGPQIFVKRDDLTGLGFGGNKVRKLEYLMPVILESKSDYIVTGAFVQSNWCTAVSAAARKFGLKVVLVKRGPEGYDPEAYEGNHLLHFLLGSEMKIVQPGTDEQIKEQVVKKLRQGGHKPFLIGVGGNTPHGVAGYVDAMKELARQAHDISLNINYVVHASGSGGTQAGSVIGAKMFSKETKIVCSSTGSRTKEEGTKLVMELIAETVEFFDLDVDVREEDVRIHDTYVGGYGYVTPGKMEAIKLLAETEGLFLDPVYTGSGMACLIDLCRKGLFKKSDVVVFIHTGGQAGLFPYKDPLKSYGLGQPLPWSIPLGIRKMMDRFELARAESCGITAVVDSTPRPLLLLSACFSTP